MNGGRLSAAATVNLWECGCREDKRRFAWAAFICELGYRAGGDLRGRDCWSS